MSATNGLALDQPLAAPVHADEAEQPMFDLVHVLVPGVAHADVHDRMVTGNILSAIPDCLALPQMRKVVRKALLGFGLTLQKRHATRHAPEKRPQIRFYTRQHST